MKDIKKMTSNELRSKLMKCIKVQDRTSNFESLQYDISYELSKRNRSKIFKIACKVIKNRYFSNQFAAAANYADAVISGCDYFDTDDHHEIGSFYTKSGNPVIVNF